MKEATSWKIEKENNEREVIERLNEVASPLQILADLLELQQNSNSRCVAWLVMGCHRLRVAVHGGWRGAAG